jgi:RNA polymerase sigma-70 factor (ECF subfamily)
MDASDEERMARCRAGDEEAFRALYDAHAGRVKAYFLRAGFAPADADDLTQQVFLRVFRSIHTYDPARGSVTPWLGAIARNVARKVWARRPEPEHVDPELAEAMFAAGPNPSDPAELHEELDALAVCIEALPVELARLIHLRYVQARTTRGMAALTGMPEATVRLHLKKAARLLEQCLDAKGVWR